MTHVREVTRRNIKKEFQSALSSVCSPRTVRARRGSLCAQAISQHCSSSTFPTIAGASPGGAPASMGAAGMPLPPPVGSCQSADIKLFC